MENEGVVALSEFTARESRKLSFLTLFGTSLDFWSHHAENGRAILSNRALISQIPVVGETVADSIGNFGYSAAGGIAFTLTGELLWELGEHLHSEILQTIAKFMPIAGIIAITFANIGRELMDLLTKGNPQITPDIVFGLAGVLIATSAVTGTINRIRQGQIKKLAMQGEIGSM